MTDDLLPQTPQDVAHAPVETSFPSRRPIGPPPTIISLLQIVLCSGLPTQLLLQFGAMLLGLVGPQGELSLSYAAWLLSVDAVLTVLLILFFLKLSGDLPSLVFFGYRPPALETVLGLLLLPVAFSIVLVTGLLVQRFAPSLHQPENPFGKLIREPNGVLIIGGLGVLAGAIREEIQRAFAMHRFTQMGAPALGLIAFSLAFGLGHGFQGADAMIMTTLLGLLWGGVYLARRSLVAPAVCHAAFNLVQVLAYGLLVSQQHTSGR